MIRLVDVIHHAAFIVSGSSSHVQPSIKKQGSGPLIKTPSILLLCCMILCKKCSAEGFDVWYRITFDSRKIRAVDCRVSCLRSMEILAVVGVREIVKVVVVSCCFSYLYPQPKVLDGDVVYRFAFFVSSSYPPDLAAYKKHLLLHYRSQMKIFFSASFHRILCNDRASQVML